jgi:hypothetical protein
MSRLWTPGQPVNVLADAEGAPHRFRWQGRSHHVTGIAKRWRVDQGWWRWRTWREYYKLYTDTGLLVLLYRDLLTDAWFLQRLYD